MCGSGICMTIFTPHGGYQNLIAFKSSTVVYDLTAEFCKLYVKDWRMRDQMIQAARSGRQNIAEGSQTSATSKRTEIHLVSVARSSLEELLLDYKDYLRQRKLPEWGKDHAETRVIRQLGYRIDRSCETYTSYMAQPEAAANAIICIIYQTTYLLNRLMLALEQDFLENGGFKERMTAERNKIKYGNKTN